jgi:hypothetical protein
MKRTQFLDMQLKFCEYYISVQTRLYSTNLLIDFFAIFLENIESTQRNERKSSNYDRKVKKQ